ncbi:MAG TPA: hypothetical protein VGN98_18640 [Tianweitania sediminis]|nr:hypothetical protein [Tianweitania sediminis]
MKLFKAATKPPRQVTVPATKGQPYATILRNGHEQEIPKEEIDRLLSAYAEQLKPFKAELRRIEKASAKALETGSVDPKIIASAEALVAEVRPVRDQIEQYDNDIHFSRESSADRIYNMFDKYEGLLDTAQHELEMLVEVRDDPGD